MRRGILLLLLLTPISMVAAAQGVLGNLLSGDLVNPKTGAWAWYDLKDAASGKAFVVRMAIVDEEKVDTRTGYWFELEIVPLVGYRSVYKMLLTGPAKDPGNIQKMISREGLEEPQEIKIDKEDLQSAQPQSDPERKLVGQEQVTIGSGTSMQVEHYELSSAEGKTDLWINSEVRPMGLVKLKSSQGELTLRKNGIGGRDARSVINDPPVLGGSGDNVKVEVHTEKQPGKEDSGTTPQKATPPKPKPDAAPEAESEASKR